MPRTPVFVQPQLDNLWELGIHGYVEPHRVVGWMNGPDTFEVGAIGSQARSQAHRRGFTGAQSTSRRTSLRLMSAQFTPCLTSRRSTLVCQVRTCSKQWQFSTENDELYVY